VAILAHDQFFAIVSSIDVRSTIIHGCYTTLNKKKNNKKIKKNSSITPLCITVAIELAFAVTQKLRRSHPPK